LQKSVHDLKKKAGAQMSSITKKTFSAGDYIFFEGDLETHFYIIESGTVKIFTKNKAGQRVEIAKFGAGETFGEFALIDTGVRSASALAFTEVKVLQVSEEGYQTMLEDLPVWAASMLKSFMLRLKRMNSVLKSNE
jgi:CRP/FNR family transcriptional regulator, cyclic AMP receptor protein